MLTPTLPDLNALDREALLKLLLAEHDERVAIHQRLLARETEIEHLKLLLAKLRRMQFGRRSEKIARQIEQLELRLEDLESKRAEAAAPAEAQPAASAEAPNLHIAAKPARHPLPAHLPRKTKRYEPVESACPDCGGKLQLLGEDVSEMLEYVPAQFQVIRQVRPKLCCTSCERIVQAPAPSRPIERGLAGPGLLAHVLVSKYADHLPLYRQSQIYARQGVDLDRSTLADWVGSAAQLLQPLVQALARYTMAACKLHGDDTPMPVLDPGRGTTKTGRMWTYVRDDRPAGSGEPPAVIFYYAPDRKGERPWVHLATFQGIFQADGFSGF